MPQNESLINRMADAELTISKLGSIGDGICQENGETVYVERAIPGDKVRVHLRKDPEGILRGEIKDLLEPSPHRQSAPCPHYDYCGNCTLQHLKKAFYQEWKQEVVKEAFKKQRLQPNIWLPPIFLEGQNRRRLTFSVTRKENSIVLGYYRRRSSVLFDIDSCGVADPILFGLRHSLKPLLPSLLLKGKTIDIFLQRVGRQIDLVVSGSVGRRGVPDTGVLKAFEQLMVFSPVVRVSWRDPESEDVKILLENNELISRFGKLNVKLPPAAFLQPTLEGEQALVQSVMEALPTKGIFADLFSGCGTFTGSMMEKGEVEAFDSVPSAILALGNAGQGKNLKATCRDLARNPLSSSELNRYDALVFDPPRGGCPEQAREMARSEVKVLIGVSCNPATFARDARLLCGGGYHLQSLQIVDQFQWSHHVEIVGVFLRGAFSKFSNNK